MHPLKIYANNLLLILRFIVLGAGLVLSSNCFSQANNNIQRDTIVKLPSGLNHSPSTKFFAVSDSTISAASMASKESRKVNMNKRVLGWHPSWMGNLYESYQFDVLTHIVFFGPEIKSAGSSIAGLNFWSESKLPEFAKKQNPSCSVLINLFASGAELRSLFLNTGLEDQLISTLINSIQNQHADGACLDFELVSSDLFSPALKFIQKLSAQFKKEGLQLCMTLPSNPPKNLHVSVLNGIVDFFILMTYDYRGAFTKTEPGPIAPLYSVSPWINLSINNSIALYKNTIPDSLLCIGIPYFGAIWEVDSRKIPSKGEKFIGYRPYSKSATLLNHFVHDSVPHCAYYTYHTTEGDSSTLRQYWSDDVHTLSDKYDYVNRMGLGGIGIWTLGMDAGRTELWDLLRSKFGAVSSSSFNELKTDTIGSDTLNVRDPTIIDTASGYITQVRKYSFTLGFIAMVLAILIFAIMVRMWSSLANRNKLRDQNLYFIIGLNTLVLLFGIGSILLKLLFEFDWIKATMCSIGITVAFALIVAYKVHRQKIQP